MNRGFTTNINPQMKEIILNLGKECSEDFKDILLKNIWK